MDIVAQNATSGGDTVRRMNMKFEKPKNPNYAATVVKLDQFVKLDNCDNVQAAIIFSNSVIVGKNCQAGDVGLFFPVECALSHEFLSNNNLYRHSQFGNIDATKTGFFEQNRRIKAMRFRGNKSEGFWIPLSSLSYLGAIDLKVGDVFDRLGDHEICEKYIIKTSNSGGPNAGRAKVAKLKDLIVDGQFRFHFDTEQLRRNLGMFKPDTIISISDKWHGTSAIFGNLLVQRQLNWIERMLVRLGINIQTHKYGPIYSSRTVVKNVDGLDRGMQHFYDVWGIVAKEIESRIPTGYTIYGEIVGYTPTGKAIQAAPGGKPYSYGCKQGEHKLVVYRVTSTNFDGQTIELSWPQMLEFCSKFGLETVKQLYYGTVGDFIQTTLTKAFLPVDDRDFQTWFMRALEQAYVHDGMCPYCDNAVPAEGIVVRIDHLNECQSYKLKNFLFVEGETKLLDQGVTNIEDEESSVTE